MALSLFAVIFVVGVALLVIPEKFTATASVVVSNVSTDAVEGAQSQTQNGENYISTQVSIINSPRVAREVAKYLKLDANPQLTELWRQATNAKGDKLEWLSNILLDHLKVQSSRQSNVINISYVSTKPESAAQTANAFAHVYLSAAAALKSNVANQNAQFFDSQLNKAREQLESVQTRLSEAEKKSGVVVSSERMDVENSRMADLSTQLALAHAQYAESSARVSSARGDGATSPDVIQNGVIQQLKGEIAKRESQLSELGGRLGDRHPQYIRAQQEIDQMRASLSAETSRVGLSISTADRIGARKVSEIQGMVNEQRRRILALSQAHDQLSVLQREVDSAQRAYELVMQRASQTNLQSLAAQTDVSLLSSAVAPTEPSFPKIKPSMAMALVLGLLLGVGLVLLRDMLNPRIYGEEHLSAITGIPVLGIVPTYHQLLSFGTLRRLAGAQKLIANNGNVS